MVTTTLVSFDALKTLAQTEGKQVFSILHTNDMHSNVVGVGPLRDYTPLSLKDDETKGGYARLGALIAERKAKLEQLGAVLVLDGGDFSMGTAVAAACRELGAELQLMGAMGYDLTTFGNHEFDLGPDGLGKAIKMAKLANRIPTVLASNSDLSAEEKRLETLQELANEGIIKPYQIIERNGLRFGIIGLIGYDAFKYAVDPGGVKFTDPIETAQTLAKQLKEKDKVDIVIALSHGGVIKGKNGNFDEGEDVNLLKAVPDLDIVIGGHTHTMLETPLLVENRPVVQSGKYGENLGELILSFADGKINVESYRLIPIDDEIEGDSQIQAKVESFLQQSGEVAFASRGYATTQPLAVISEDWPINYADIEGGTPLANLFTDAIREATGSQMTITANGIIRAGLIKGKSGIQTVYDIFTLAPLGGGIVDQTAGSALVEAYFTAQEIKNMLEFFLIDDPNHPGEYFPRVSGLRFYYDPKRPRFEQVTAIELGNLDEGYQEMDLQAPTLYRLSTSLYAGAIMVAIPKLSKGALSLQAKKANGTPLTNRIDALADPRESTSPYILPTNGNLDPSMMAMSATQQEIKEWQAIMDYLVKLPQKNAEGISILTKDERAKEVRGIKISHN